jgi:serine/threonine protein kinase
MNTNKPSAPLCPRCGAVLAADAAEGLCPRCLLALNLGPQTQLTGEDATGRQPAAPPSIAELEPLFPQLEILELLGRGGMGAVYRARQKQLDRIVALKILPPGVGNDAAFAARFATEARALAKLNHPNIVTIHDFGCVSTADTHPSTPDTRPSSTATRPASLDTLSSPLFFFVMEFVDGMNLRQLMAAGRLAPREALAIVPQICDALQYAHDAGIVHRDIKPENILLDRRGRVKVADFGLAKLVGQADSKLSGGDAASIGNRQSTIGNVIMGTPQYMAPEQRERPTEVDHRADIYSLGVVFYQMLTGELPKGDFAPPSKQVVLDVRLDEVVLRALEKNPELRYQHVSDVKTLVETIATTPPPANAATPVAPAGSLPKLSLSYISTPAHLRSFRGRFINIYKGKGELCLDQETLSFRSGWPTVTIPLASIRKLAQGDYPYSAKPVPLHFIAVTFEERGEERTLLFTPVIREVMVPDAANKLSDEWLAALQAAYRTCTGRSLAVERSDIAQDRFWVLKTMLVMAAFCTVALWTIPLVLHQRLPSGWNEWLPLHALIMAPTITAMFLGLRWLQRRLARQPGRSDSPQAPLGDQAATCTGQPALGLAPRKTGMTRLLEIFFDTTFTSPLAIKLANFSIFGFLGSLGFLRAMPLPGWERCAGFFGFFGIFGIIGVAYGVEMFVRAKAAPVPNPGENRAAPGAAGRLAYMAFAMLYLAVAVGVLITAPWLPERVATHFGIAGAANGWMTRTGYLTFVTTFPLLLALFFAGISALIKILPACFCNIPNRDFWLAPERRATTVVLVRHWLAGLLCLMTLFFGALHVLTIGANRSTPPQLPMGGLLLLVILFLLALMIWLTLFLMRFAEIRTAGKSAPPPPVPSLGKNDATAFQSVENPARGAARLSRTATVGVCWTLLAILLIALTLMVVGYPAREVQPAWSPWLGWLKIALALVAFTAPFGTTLLGWIAVVQIRRPAGELYGLGLAVFDGLLFPLLALDALLGWLMVGCARLFVDFYSNPSVINRPEINPPLTTRAANLFAAHQDFAPLIAVLLVLVVDLLIIRSLWRAVRKPVSRAGAPGTSNAAASEPPLSKPSRTATQPSATTRSLWCHIRHHFVVVGRRKGKAVIHWSGVRLGFALVIGVMVLVSWLCVGRIDARIIGPGFLLALAVMGGKIIGEFLGPVEKLRPLDEPVATASRPQTPPQLPNAGKAGTAVFQDLGPTARAKRYGKLALALCLGGLVLPIVWLVLRLPPQTRLGALMWMGVFGVTSIVELAALVFGIMGWKSGTGKAAVLVAAVLPFLAVPGSLAAYWMMGRASQQRWLDEEQRNRAYLAKVEAVLRVETQKQLENFHVRCDHIKVIASSAFDSATLLLAHPQELRGVGGSNVWTGINGLLTARPKGDGYWEVSGDQDLQRVRFTVQVPVPVAMFHCDGQPLPKGAYSVATTELTNQHDVVVRRYLIETGSLRHLCLGDRNGVDSSSLAPDMMTNERIGKAEALVTITVQSAPVHAPEAVFAMTVTTRSVIARFKRELALPAATDLRMLLTETKLPGDALLTNKTTLLRAESGGKFLELIIE